MDAALHEWNLSPKQAIALQSQLAQRLESRDRLDPVRYIAGVDIGFEEEGGVAARRGIGGRIGIGRRVRRRFGVAVTVAARAEHHAAGGDRAQPDEKATPGDDGWKRSYRLTLGGGGSRVHGAHPER